MGKQSKKAAPKSKDLPGWHEALPKATVENVVKLPQVDHGWICTLIQNPNLKKTHPHGILAIFDITNRVRGEGTQPRSMNLGPCPDPQKESDEIAKALLATMMAPAEKPTNDDSPAYYQPRRPAWVLLEKELAVCLPTVKDQLAAVDVAVQLNTPQALGGEKKEKGLKATWDKGLTMGATAENVKGQPIDSEQVWKCSMTMLQDKDTGAKECFLAVENITAGTAEDESFPVGVGPCPPPTVNPDGLVLALLATMLSPRAKQGGYDEAGRPGRVVLDKPLEPWLEHIQTKVAAVGVSVEVAA